MIMQFVGLHSCCLEAYNFPVQYYGLFDLLSGSDRYWASHRKHVLLRCCIRSGALNINHMHAIVNLLYLNRFLHLEMPLTKGYNIHTIIGGVCLNFVKIYWAGVHWCLLFLSREINLILTIKEIWCTTLHVTSRGAVHLSRPNVFLLWCKENILVTNLDFRHDGYMGDKIRCLWRLPIIMIYIIESSSSATHESFLSLALPHNLKQRYV